VCLREVREGKGSRRWGLACRLFWVLRVSLSRYLFVSGFCSCVSGCVFIRVRVGICGCAYECACACAYMCAAVWGKRVLVRVSVVCVLYACMFAWWCACACVSVCV